MPEKQKREMPSLCPFCRQSAYFEKQEKSPGYLLTHSPSGHCPARCSVYCDDYHCAETIWEIGTYIVVINDFSKDGHGYQKVDVYYGICLRDLAIKKLAFLIGDDGDFSNKTATEILDAIEKTKSPDWEFTILQLFRDGTTKQIYCT